MTALFVCQRSAKNAGEAFAYHVWLSVRLAEDRERGTRKPHLFFWRRDDGLVGCRAQDPNSQYLLGRGKGTNVREAACSCWADIRHGKGT